ncbi:hypothetical protein [Pseudomonas pergaminensis]
MNDLPQSVISIFNDHPELQKIIPHPVQLTDHALLDSVTTALSKVYGKLQHDDFYQVVFKNGSSQDLLALKNGELAGFLTTTCVNKGKFSDVAGLKKVNDALSMPLLHSMLNVMIYRSLKAELSYISHIVTDIRNDQILTRQAIFERINEVIIDCYHSIPDAALDETLRGIQLTRIIKNSDDCFELYVQQREELKTLTKQVPQCHELYYPAGSYQDGQGYYSQFNIEDFFKSKVLNHSVFSLFERMTATKVCELLLSENYSENNYTRIRRQLVKIAGEIRECLIPTISKLDSASDKMQRESADQHITRHEENIRIEALKRQQQGAELLRGLLEEKLEGKLRGLELLKQSSAKGEWSVFLLNGVLLVNNESKNNA